MSASNQTPEEMSTAEVTLESVIIALQKTFSRVARDTRTAATEGRELAVVVGGVEFSVSCAVGPAADHLVLADDGPVQISLSGTIETEEPRAQASG